jgi:hypothetical protein
VRKLLAVLCLLSGLAYADGTQMLKSTTPSNTGPATIVCKGTDTNNYGKYIATGQSLPYPISLATYVVVTIYSDAGSVATVDIETAPTPTGPWFNVTAAHITNPSDTSGEQWEVPPTNYVRINVTAWTSGNVRACITATRGATKIY